MLKIFGRQNTTIFLHRFCLPCAEANTQGLHAGDINTRFDNLVFTAEQSVAMSEAVSEAKPEQAAKPLGMRKNGMHLPPCPVREQGGN